MSQRKLTSPRNSYKKELAVKACFSLHRSLSLKIIYASFSKPLTPSSVQSKIFASSMQGFIRIHSKPVSIHLCMFNYFSLRTKKKKKQKRLSACIVSADECRRLYFRKRAVPYGLPVGTRERLKYIITLGNFQ